MDKNNVEEINNLIKQVEYYCAKQERCKKDVLNKMKSWGLSEDVKFLIIEKITNDDFINELRYVKLFCKSKIRSNKWGRVKIKNELIKKNISKDIINHGLQEIDEEEYLTLLEDLIKKKSKLIMDKNKFSKKKKIASFLLQKGFESEIIWENINNLIE